ncbi:MAG: S-layer homology domain-containing protein [Cyanobacteria bacterium Co-bin13]|nr:S-layer homology domain-containing protein [Cyanobacteria bacterium Co-bin13]
MLQFSKWQLGGAALVALGTVSGVTSTLVTTTPAAAQQANFSDVSFGYWARPFIERLAQENIIAGFPDGTFKPNQPVTRAQFAAIVEQAFDQPGTRSAPNFPDVAANYWARDVISGAYSSGFLSGYPDGRFQPAQEIPRVQALVSLANGLNFSPQGTVNEALSLYRDEGEVPRYAQDAVAAATQRNMVVNYPTPNVLNPQRPATRAEVAAFVYQALVAQGKLPALEANSETARYIVGYGTGTSTVTNPTTPTTPTNQNSSLRVEAGTPISVRYPNAGNNQVDIIVAPGQTVAASLEVAQPIRNAAGQVLVPVGSTLQGRIVPVNIQGSSITAAQFVADSLTVGNNNYPVRAVSSPVAATQNVNQSTLQGALVTTAAQSILGPLLGNQNIGNVIGQVITGSGNATSQNAVVVINPNQLDLRVDSAFSVNQIAQN